MEISLCARYKTVKALAACVYLTYIHVQPNCHRAVAAKNSPTQLNFLIDVWASEFLFCLEGEGEWT